MILPIDPSVQRQLERAVGQCGVTAADAEITYEDYLQSEQIVIKSKSLSDDQINCILKITRGPLSPVVFFEDESTSQRSYVLERSLDRAAAREWLQENGRLDALPEFDPKTEKLDGFARRIEAYCEIEPGSVLMVHELGALTFRKEWMELSLEKPLSEVEGERFTCLLNALWASNLEEHGIGFGVIGNEVNPEAPPAR